MGGTACACRFKLASVHTQHTLADHPRLTHKSVVRVLQQVLANVLSSAIGGMVHACVEQPVTTPIEASITQMQINGKGFFSNFRQLSSLGVVNGLYQSGGAEANKKKDMLAQASGPAPPPQCWTARRAHPHPARAAPRPQALMAEMGKRNAD